MKPELILMLTYNDETVKDAMDVFEEIKDIPISYFGFKDVGLPPDEMKMLRDSIGTSSSSSNSTLRMCSL